MQRVNKTILVLAVLVGLAAAGLVSTATFAGALNPAPTARTGQTTSFEAGDDGDLQEGVQWPTPRFTDNDDGTVTDNLTGLVWLKDTTRFTPRAWVQALNACNGLADDGVALTDGSVAGDWRLPNNKELRRLIDFGSSRPALPGGHPFIVPSSGSFWSSTTSMNNVGRAWKILIEDGEMRNDQKGTANFVWPVRDGTSGDLGPAPVPKTGRTISFGPRDDGALQKGVEWPEPRFTDNLDGTVTDHLTGLLWLKDSTRFMNLSWSEALETCNELADDGVALTDGSLPGDWRLPNVWELGSLNDFSQQGPALPEDTPFILGGGGTFWTSTTVATSRIRAWTIGQGIGRVVTGLKRGSLQAWPVRGAMPVAFDVKPGSCPNPVNLNSAGALPVAVLGTADFDVMKIDPISIRLEGVAPIRSSLEDVATPFDPFTGKEHCSQDCSGDGPDGWLDMTFKFDNQEIVEALGETYFRECRVVTLTGNLREEFGSTPIEGEDVILILIPKRTVPVDPTETRDETKPEADPVSPVNFSRQGG
jgi:hypothetical protein